MNSSHNKKSLTQIAHDKEALELYITNLSYSFDYDEDEMPYMNIGGLLIQNGDIDNTYNWSTIVYPGLSRWDDGNACTDDVREILTPLVDWVVENTQVGKSWSEYSEKFLKENGYE